MPSFNTKRIFDFPEVTTATSSHKILIENSAGLAGYINPVNLVSSVIASTTVPLDSIQTIGASTLLGSVAGGAPAALNVSAVKSILNYQFDNIGGQLNVNNNMVVNSTALFNRTISTNTVNGAYGSDVTAEIRTNGTLSTINTPKLGFQRVGESAASIGFYGTDSSGPNFTAKGHDGSSKRIAYVENNLGIYPYVNWIKMHNFTTDDYVRLVFGEYSMPNYVATFSMACGVGAGIAIAGHSGGVFRWLSFSGGAGGARNASIALPYPKSINVYVSNDFGGNHYFYINNGGFIEVEFCLAPNSYRRMRWNGNGTNWQFGVNKLFSAGLALTGNTALMADSGNSDNSTLYAPSIDYGYYSTSVAP